MPLSPTQKYWHLPWAAYVSLLLLTLLQPYLPELTPTPSTPAFPAVPTYDDPIIIQPRFAGCPAAECTHADLENYLYQQTTYRASPANSGQAGLAVVRITVTASGTISEVEILRDPGYGRGADALRIAQKMRERPVVWAPARTVSGRAVDAMVLLKIRYSNFTWAR